MLSRKGVTVMFWDIIVEVEDDEERTVRGLTETQTIELLDLFESAGVPATAIEYTQDGESTGNKRAVLNATNND